MLNPQKKHGGEHPNVYYMLCVAHSDARRFFKYTKLLTAPYKKEETAHKVVAYINPKMSVLVNE